MQWAISKARAFSVRRCEALSIFLNCLTVDLWLLVGGLSAATTAEDIQLRFSKLPGVVVTSAEVVRSSSTGGGSSNAQYC